MRSWLYVPDVREVGAGRADGAAEAADALVVDLERAGDPAGVRSWIEAASGRRAGAGRPAVWARLAGGEAGHRAVRDVVSPALSGICVAAESANELAALGTVVAEAEEAVGLRVGSVAVIARLASAAAVLQAAEIARAPRVARLQLAEGPLIRQLRVEPGRDERELLWARSMVVLAGAAAGLRPPLAAACPAGTDCEPSATALRRLGFGGRTCLDGEQVRVANRVFANA
ncbi:CoA ester lyase [Dactylosporangium aurantiacum]|uniref:CoA ester lyase n=1 Tax=Dactylosporangium aurantiacum TaxID=35754 RepID=A0A9Q9IM28_9ACTN|nr:aldolase/citrate lyase family protein [Dactylosporangium aurantiacum]MDG6108986.1 aldolase/citrate lyase family protein [Dactylosporangium aurantiacum]UWZ56510.1 CoA ester lyase [Dactylosporangium aurantiacum]